MALCAEHTVAVHSLPQSSHMFEHESPSAIYLNRKVQLDLERTEIPVRLTRRSDFFLVMLIDT